MKIIFMVGLCFLLVDRNVSAQQYVVANLVNTTIQDRICVQPESVITHGVVTRENIELRELPVGVSGGLSFNLVNVSGTDDVTIGLEASMSGVSGDQYTYRFSNGRIQIVDPFGVVEVGNVMSATDQFEIIRCQNAITYLLNDVPMLQRFTPDIPEPLAAIVDVSSSIQADLSLVFGAELSCAIVSHDLDNDYVDLDVELNDHYIKVTDEVRFKYIEKYAIVDQVNGKIKCQILDWQLTPIGGTFELDNVHGVNWQVLEMPSAVLSGEYYTLKVMGANKDEVYYLRIKKI